MCMQTIARILQEDLLIHTARYSEIATKILLRGTRYTIKRIKYNGFNRIAHPCFPSLPCFMIANT